MNTEATTIVTAITNPTELAHGDDAVLIAWLGGQSLPVAGWPTTDRRAFEDALPSVLMGEPLGLIDDRDDPIPVDHEDHTYSLAACLAAIVIQERDYL